MVFIAPADCTLSMPVCVARSGFSTFVVAPQVVRAGFYGAKGGDKPSTRPDSSPNWLDEVTV